MTSNNFYYKKGLLETTIPWNRPSKDIFNRWLQDFLLFPEVNNYEVYLCGGFLEQKWETWDIDIVLTGPVSIPHLEKILIDGLYLGLYKYNILVDIQHQKELIWPFKSKRMVEKIVSYDKIIKNKTVITDLTSNPTFEKLSDNLWRIQKEEPTEKQKARIRKDFNYDKPPLLLSRDTQFI